VIVLDRTGQRRDSVGMKNDLSKAKSHKTSQPFEVVKMFSVLARAFS
jgi:hypothetical protein